MSLIEKDYDDTETELATLLRSPQLRQPGGRRLNLNSITHRSHPEHRVATVEYAVLITDARRSSDRNVKWTPLLWELHLADASLRGRLHQVVEQALTPLVEQGRTQLPDAEPRRTLLTPRCAARLSLSQAA